MMNESETTEGKQFGTRISRPFSFSVDDLIKDILVYLQCDPFAMDSKKIASWIKRDFLKAVHLGNAPAC